MNLTCYVCLRLSECMNPFLYNVASKKMRRASLRTIGRLLLAVCGIRWSVWERYENSLYKKKPKSLATDTMLRDEI